RPVTTASIVQQAIDMVQAQADSKEIKIDSNTIETTVEADQDRMRRVLLNLLGNAIKFTPPGRKITVSAIDVTAGEGVAEVEMRVTDEGPGIPPEQAELVFQKFRQLESGGAERQGSGLGLAICKAVVEAHGGTIGVEPAEGGGSSFWLRIP